MPKASTGKIKKKRESGCLNCYGKGFSTEYKGKSTAFADFGDEFGGEERVVVDNGGVRINYCKCAKGKRLKHNLVK